MSSNRNQPSQSSSRDHKRALVVFLCCVASSVALILISCWGMVTLKLSSGEFLFGALLTFTLALLLTGGGALAYLSVKSRPEPVKVLASRASSQHWQK